MYIRPLICRISCVGSHHHGAEHDLACFSRHAMLDIHLGTMHADLRYGNIGLINPNVASQADVRECE